MAKIKEAGMVNTGFLYWLELFLNDLSYGQANDYRDDRKKYVLWNKCDHGVSKYPVY